MGIPKKPTDMDRIKVETLGHAFLLEKYSIHECILLQTFSGIYRTATNLQKLEAYSELYQLSKMECFAKIFNNIYPLTIFTKRSILNV